MITRRQIRFKTFQLWNGLLNPPEGNPVFQYIRHTPFPWSPGVRWLFRILHPMWQLIGPLVRLIIAVGAPVLLPLAANLIGVLFAYYVSSFISRERERGTYDLLALTPAGEWDTAWAICLASIYRFNLLLHINFMRVMAILGVILLAFPVFAAQRDAVVVLIAAGIAMQFDAIQTIVIGCLCGMLGQTYSAAATNAGTWGAALFGAVQIMVYVPVALAYSLTVFVHGLRYSDIGIAAPIVVLLLPFLLHEFVIRALWTILRYRLQ